MTIIVASHSIRTTTWYDQFLADPISFLSERDIGEIIVVGRREESKGFYEKFIEFDNLIFDKEIAENIFKNEPQLEELANKRKLVIVNHLGRYRVHPQWEFVFFNYKIEDRKLVDFKNCVKGSQMVNLDTKSIIKTIKDKTSRKKLSGCYKKIRQDLNQTSLALYHGPINNSRLSLISNETCPLSVALCLFPWAQNFEKEFGGQLLVGDLNLNTKYNEFRDHYIDCLYKVSILQVPHHGANSNWNNSIWNDIPNCQVCVASAGISSRAGHPSYEVICDILNHVYCGWSNQLNKITFYGDVQF
jgi:hypothetical protein